MANTESLENAASKYVLTFLCIPPSRRYVRLDDFHIMAETRTKHKIFVAEANKKRHSNSIYRFLLISFIMNE